MDEIAAGVAPGGLTEKEDIKILICYILSGIKGSLSKEDIISTLKDNNLVNYFDANDAFSDLISKKLIVKNIHDENLYDISEEGKMIAKQLYVSLPLSIREKTLKAALKALTIAKIKKENSVTINKNDFGYFVNFNVSGSNIDLMKLGMYVPDSVQANLVKSNFYKNPEIIYSVILALLTNDKNLVKEILEKLS